jgi:hypothetical protein
LARNRVPVDDKISAGKDIAGGAMDEEDNIKGFAGLSSLASKIDKKADAEVPDQAPKQERVAAKSAPNAKSAPKAKSAQKKKWPVTAETSPKGKSSKAPRPPPPKPPAKRSSSSGWKWLLVIAGIIVVALIIGASQEPDPYTPSSSNNRQTRMPASRPDNSITPITKSAPTRTQPTITFEKPPIATGQVLTMAAIRWCMREKIRIDIRRPLANQNGGISLFNQGVQEYNLRCRSYRYRQGDLEWAKSQVEKQREAIERATRREFTPDRRSSGVGTGKAKASASDVREAQRLLTELGYQPGVIDGRFGRNTANAIREFHRKSGLTSDGRIDQELLSALKAARDKRLRGGVSLMGTSLRISK